VLTLLVSLPCQTDPHPGNLMALPGSDSKGTRVAILDFGQVERHALMALQYKPPCANAQDGIPEAEIAVPAFILGTLFRARYSGHIILGTVMDAFSSGAAWNRGMGSFSERLPISKTLFILTENPS